MMHKAWCSTEKVPFCFWCHPSNFKVTQVEKSKDFSPIWVRLQSRSQLSNPSDLPCLIYFILNLIVACILCVVYVREDNDFNVKFMITRPVWTTWTCPLSQNRPLNLINHSLTHSLTQVRIPIIKIRLLQDWSSHWNMSAGMRCSNMEQAAI